MGYKLNKDQEKTIPEAEAVIQVLEMLAGAQPLIENQTETFLQEVQAAPTNKISFENANVITEEKAQLHKNTRLMDIAIKNSFDPLTLAPEPKDTHKNAAMVRMMARGQLMNEIENKSLTKPPHERLKDIEADIAHQAVDNLVLKQTLKSTSFGAISSGGATAQPVETSISTEPEESSCTMSGESRFLTSWQLLGVLLLSIILWIGLIIIVGISLATLDGQHPRSKPGTVETQSELRMKELKVP